MPFVIDSVSVPTRTSQPAATRQASTIGICTIGTAGGKQILAGALQVILIHSRGNPVVMLELPGIIDTAGCYFGMPEIAG